MGAIDLLNAGKPLSGWARGKSVAEINQLAAELGVRPRPTRAATLSAIERAPRPALIEEGLKRVMSRQGLKRWAKRARKREIDEVARRLGIDPGRSKAGTLVNIEVGANRARQVQRQIGWFEQTRPARAERFVGAFQAERRWLAEALERSASPNRYVELKRRRAAIGEFHRRVGKKLERVLLREVQDIHRHALTHLEKLTPVARKAAEKALERHRLLRVYSPQLQKLLADVRDRAMRLAVLRARPADIAGQSSQIAQYGKRIGLLARMLVGQVYNDAQIVAGEHVTAKTGKVTYKRIVEVIDSRNHPFSLAANGMRVKLKESFRVPASEVDRWAQVLRKSVGGIFWPLNGGFYTGAVLPAHYNDRGYIIVEVQDAG